MAECKECLHYDICEIMNDQYGISKIHPIQCGFYKNTADVVPKSEVEELSGKYEDLKLKYADLQKDKDELIAWGNDKKTEYAREIFAEIEKLSYYAPTPYDDEINVVDYEDIAELKKKYT